MLKGNSVILTRAGTDDSELLYKWRSDPTIYKNFANQDELNFDHHKKWFEKNSDNYYFIISDLKGQALGLTLLENIDLRNRRCFWGVYIAEKRHRGQGYAHDASKLALKFGFEYLNLNKIYGTTLSINERGRQFHENLGFKEEAVLSEFCFFKGVYNDLIYISIKKDDLKKNDL
jgi:RimJ/RimL family protein N-acetyltransferase